MGRSSRQIRRGNCLVGRNKFRFCIYNSLPHHSSRRIHRKQVLRLDFLFVVAGLVLLELLAAWLVLLVAALLAAQLLLELAPLALLLFLLFYSSFQI